MAVRLGCQSPCVFAAYSASAAFAVDPMTKSKKRNRMAPRESGGCLTSSPRYMSAQPNAADLHVLNLEFLRRVGRAKREPTVTDAGVRGGYVHLCAARLCTRLGRHLPSALYESVKRYQNR